MDTLALTRQLVDLLNPLHAEYFRKHYPHIADMHQHDFNVKDSRTWIKLDRNFCSGCMVVNKSTGDVYRISAYGVPDKRPQHYLGKITNL